MLIFFIKYLPIARTQKENAQNLLKFGQIDISNMPISIFNVKNIYHLLDPNWFNIESVQNLLKSDTLNISILPISI